MDRKDLVNTRDVISNFGDPKAVVREWRDKKGDTLEKIGRAHV